MNNYGALSAIIIWKYTKARSFSQLNFKRKHEEGRKKGMNEQNKKNILPNTSEVQWGLCIPMKCKN